MAIIKEIMETPLDDGVAFQFQKIEPIREDDAYNNFRITVNVKYGKINSPMKIDITTGDTITPAAIRYDYPLIFEDKSLSIMTYTLETVMAEKYETIIRRNIGDTRARDFYDLHTLYRERKSSIRIDVLRQAAEHTASKRGSLEELKDWCEILSDMREEPQLYTLWRNYAAENAYAKELQFHDVLDTVEIISKELGL